MRRDKMARIRVAVSVASCKGDFRKVNQDQFLLNGMQPNRYLEDEGERMSSYASFQMYGVFDGMGGGSQGEQAALIAVEVAESYRQCLAEKKIPSKESTIRQYFQEANEKICKLRQQEKVKLCGTTAALVWKDKLHFYGANIGDTRIYLWRQKHLQQLSVDHTQQSVLDRIKGYVAEQQKTEAKHVLTQYLGIEPDEMCIEPYFFKLEAKHKDILLICSDGLYEKMDEEKITQLMIASHNLKSMEQNLLKEAAVLGSRDNRTLLLLEIHKVLF